MDFGQLLANGLKILTFEKSFAKSGSPEAIALIYNRLYHQWSYYDDPGTRLVKLGKSIGKGNLQRSVRIPIAFLKPAIQNTIS